MNNKPPINFEPVSIPSFINITERIIKEGKAIRINNHVVIKANSEIVAYSELVNNYYEFFVNKKYLEDYVSTQKELDLGCTCHGCNAKFNNDITVPDNIWIKLYVEDLHKAMNGGGLLCPVCIITRLTLAYPGKTFKIEEC